jgi:hypothetical protein
VDAKTRQALRAGQVVVVSVDGQFVSHHDTMEAAMQATIESPERVLRILSVSAAEASRL